MQERWHFLGSVPENYERYLVPRIFAPWAEDLVEAAALRAGERKHVDTYLNEFVCRYNRRFYRHVSFETMLGLAAHHEPASYWDRHWSRQSPQGQRRAQACPTASKNSHRNAPRRLGQRPKRGPKSGFERGGVARCGRTWDNAISLLRTIASPGSALLRSQIRSACSYPNHRSSTSGLLTPGRYFSMPNVETFGAVTRGSLI